VRLPSLSSPAKRSTALILVALVSMVAFIRAPWNGYAMDDPAILANPLLHAADTLPDTLVSAWWWQGGYLYRPLTLFTFAVDQLVGNGAPSPLRGGRPRGLGLSDHLARGAGLAKQSHRPARHG
jgi:hypothetical protein